ncbi:MAG: 30S ribosomal protein S12 methylthiotransferase RimO [Halobacteriovoraceae bacterium]|nr:30S ribosomal protein S12 methylthiotransferase RimO [Halobacteriovoraceae bacterium]
MNFTDKTLYFTSLGCSKNLVDSQVMLGYLGLDGYQISQDPADAEVIIVNTCSFVESAKVESIDSVLDMADYKNPEYGKCKALVMSGCMAQRYSGDLESGMPEVDLFIGTGEYHKVAQYLKAFEEGKLEKKSFVEIPRYIHTEFDPRVNTSPGYMAWFKISEGCNRNCTFCIIPTLRGKLRSRSVNSLVTEAKKLAESGVKELNIISQDLSDYGVDLSEENDLYNLICKLEKVEGIEWIRLFYYYPDDMDERVMQKIAQSPKVCNYLDMPVQHFSTDVLRRMNRKTTTEEMVKKIERLQEYNPNIYLRTSVIVGFPGETEEDFELLKKMIQKIKFHHLGVFKYSDEEGTPAYNIKDKISEEVIENRFQEIYEIQKEISRERQKAMIGKRMKVLVEGAHPETDMLIQARHQGQAPDIDGHVIINDGLAKVGDMVEVEITDALDYDLIAKI